MTNDLISRSELLKKSIRVTETDEGGWERVLRAVPVEEIEKAEAVDAAPVVHGRWISQDSTYTKYQCSACKERNFDGVGRYCPNCGARMDKEAGNAQE